MGLFGSKVTCAICDKELGISKIQIANKEYICVDCFQKTGLSPSTPMKEKTVEDINYAIIAKKNDSEELNLFKATKKIGTYMELDDNRKKWLVPDGMFGKKKNPHIFNYSDIVDFELLEDGETITKGGLGRAIAGGVLFGGIGAVVGGVTGGRKSKPICKSLRIKITVNNISNPVVYIDFLTTETKKNSIIYKTAYNSAQECLSTLQLICNSQEQTNDTNAIENNNATAISSADEILKFKNLLDSGIITQEEFDAKKKQLLGL